MKKFLVILLSVGSVVSCVTSPKSTTTRKVAVDESVFESAHTTHRTLLATEAQQVSADIHRSQLIHHDEPTKKAVLILHGLHESPHYMQSFADYFFHQGYNVYSLLLPGHQSNDREALTKVRYTDWITAAEKALAVAQGLGQEVEVLGYSTGGTLATYLALEHPDLVKKLYLISPALALSDKVALSSYFLGWTSLDSKKICKTHDSKSFLCRIFKITDDQLYPMMKEGIISSPAAGFEVQKLINHLIRKYGPSDYFTDQESNYYVVLADIYNRLKTPLLMVGSESDNVIDASFNYEFAKEYKGKKVNILFPKKAKITHISITKPQGHGFSQAPEIYNSSFDKILEGIDQIRADE